MTDPAVEDWLQEAQASKNNLSVQDQVNLSLMARAWTCSTALPESLVREKARLEMEGNSLHTQYRDSGNWAVMKPVYEQAFAVSRQVGAILKDKLGFATAYEALLDQFNPGLKLSTVASEFAKLETALPPMIAEAMARQGKRSPVLPIGNIPIDRQARLNHRILLALGFDETRGVFYSGDMHPLSDGTPDDSRLTTRYFENNFLDGLSTTTHETGHSLYEQGTPLEWRYQPAGHTMGMDIHESQSMVIQYHATMIPEFIDYLSAEAMREFGHSFQGDPALSAANLANTLFQVQPSFIRVQADELTYPAHIILRFNLERAIIEGSLSVNDLPDAWNDGMTKIFGITPPDPSKGHMQDVHWPTLSIGYFPAYTLGAMGAAQFFAAATKSHPQIRSEIGQGNFSTLRNWLKENVHKHGSLLTQDQLFTVATGEPLNAGYYMNHLSRRYLGRDYTP
jgi:carboxypeptidase Taq